MRLIPKWNPKDRTTKQPDAPVVSDTDPDIGENFLPHEAAGKPDSLTERNHVEQDQVVGIIDAPGSETEAARQPKRRGARAANSKGFALSRSMRVSISLEQENVRVVVFRGRQIVTWGTASLAPDLDTKPDDEQIAQPVQPVDRADRLRDFLHALGVSKGSVISDLPVHVPLTRYLRVQKGQQSLLERMVLSETLETVPFSHEEVDFAWQSRPLEAKEREVQAVVVSQEAINNHVQLLRNVGLQPKSFYSKAVALTYLAGVSDGLIAFTDTRQAIVVLVSGGAPRYVHQVPFSASPTEEPEARASLVAEAVDEVVERWTIDNPDAKAPLSRTLLAGHAVADEAFVSAFRDEVPYEVWLLTPAGVSYPESFPIEEYGINIGLFMADAARGKRWTTGAMLAPPLDLLPDRQRPRPLPVRLIGAYAGLLVLGSALIFATSYVGYLSDVSAALSTQQEATERQVRQDRLALNSAGALIQDREAALVLAEHLEHHLTEADDKLDLLLRRFQTITNGAITSEVSISDIAEQGHQFGITGNATTYEAALDYTARLRASGLFEQVRLVQVAAPGGPVLSEDELGEIEDIELPEPGDGNEDDPSEESSGEDSDLQDSSDAQPGDDETAPADMPVSMTITATVAISEEQPE